VYNDFAWPSERLAIHKNATPFQGFKNPFHPERRDVGMDCDFVAKGETEEDVLQQCADHARSAHNMTEIPAEIVDKVRVAIHDEAA
jgi:predicted small metal-binding protein